MKKYIILIVIALAGSVHAESIAKFFKDSSEISLSITNLEAETSTTHRLLKENGKVFYIFSVSPLRYELQLYSRQAEEKVEVDSKIFDRILSIIFASGFLEKVQSRTNANMSGTTEIISVKASSLELSFPGFGWYLRDEDTGGLMEMKEIGDITILLEDLKNKL